jgi:hypothetical protein
MRPETEADDRRHANGINDLNVVFSKETGEAAQAEVSEDARAPETMRPETEADDRRHANGINDLNVVFSKDAPWPVWPQPPMKTGLSG